MLSDKHILIVDEEAAIIVRRLFNEFAEDECRHAARFNEILQKMEEK